MKNNSNQKYRRVLKPVLLSLLLFPDPGFAASAITPDPAPRSPVEHLELRLSTGLLPGLRVLNQPLTMEGAVMLGVQQNLDIAVARSETGVRQAMLRRARAERWPTLSVGSMTFIRGGRSTLLMTPDMTMLTGSTTVSEDLNATARLPLFTGGRILAGIRAAKSGVLGGQALEQQRAVETAYQIREAYLKALLSQTEHRVHQQHQAVEQRLLKNARARYRVGKGLKADVLRIQTELADSQRLLNETHTQWIQTLLSLKALMGIDLASQVTLSDSLVTASWLGPGIDTLIEQALTGHPKILEFEERTKAAEAQVRITRAAYLPQITGQITGNLRFPEEPTLGGNGVIGLVNASIPVFDRKRDTEVAQAMAALERTRREMKVLRLEIVKQLTQASSSFHYAGENVPLMESAVQLAEEDLRLMQRRFEVGRAIQVEVQDAALNLQNKRLAWAKAMYDQQMAKAKLLQAVGKIVNNP